MKFEIGQQVRVRVDMPHSIVSQFTKLPTGTIRGRLLGEGLDVYLVFMHAMQSNSVEFVDPENPHLELIL